MVGKVHWLAPSGGGSATEERSTRNQIAACMVDEVLLALRRLARAMHRHNELWQHVSAPTIAHAAY